MKSALKILMVIFFTLLIFRSSAQSYEPPKPRMNKNVMKSFMQMHIEYPLESIKNNEEGNVVISFRVDKSGNIVNPVIQQSVSKAVDSATLRFFSLILWEPASEYGLPIESESEFKIKYSIAKYKTMSKKRGYDKIHYPFEPFDLSGKIYTIKHLDKAPEALLESTYKNVQEFIGLQLEFPEAAAKLSLSGTVKLRFVIETSGLPSNIMIIEPVGGGCTEEAIRIVKQLKWMPGIKSGEAVRTCYDLKIRFDPADELKNKHIPSQANTGI